MFRPTYGMAECCVVATTTAVDTPMTTLHVEPKLEPGGTVGIAAPGDANLELVACGQAIDGLEAVVVDDAGQPLPERAIGEIRVRGAARFDGYWADPAATAEALADEWHVTGDLGFVHEGHIYIAGRCKDVIIQRGRHLFPEEIRGRRVRPARRAAARRPGVRPHGRDRRPREIHLVLETSLTGDERTALTDLARKTIADRLDCIVDVITFCGPRELPRTPSGKIRRSEGRARWGNES